MKRVLVVGNSHAGALKLGWAEMAQPWTTELDLQFFAAPGTFFHRMTVTDAGMFGDMQSGALTRQEIDVLQQINGRTSIDLESFDEILLTGMNWAGTDDLVPILSGFSIDRLYEVDNPQRLSVAAFTDFTRALTRPPQFPGSGLRCVIQRSR